MEPGGHWTAGTEMEEKWMEQKLKRQKVEKMAVNGNLREEKKYY